MISIGILAAAIRPALSGAVEFIASGSTAYATATSVNLGVPASSTSGDLLVAFVMHRSAITVPAGWALVKTTTGFTGSGVTQYTSCMKKVALSGDPGASVSFVQAVSGRIAGQIQTFRRAGGCDVVESASSTGPEAFSYTTPAITATSSSHMLASGCSRITANAPGTFSVGSGWSLTSTSAGSDLRFAASYGQAIAATAKACTFTAESTAITGPWGGIIVRIGAP